MAIDGEMRTGTLASAGFPLGSFASRPRTHRNRRCRHRRGCVDARLGLTFAPHRTMSESRLPAIDEPTTPVASRVPVDAPAKPADDDAARAPELDPTRYGDWEKNGRCIDF